MRKTFHLVSNSGATWLECAQFAQIPWLLHAFSTRLDQTQDQSRDPGRGARSEEGDWIRGLNLGFVPHDRPSRVVRNRRTFLDAVGAGDFMPAEAHQIHSALILCVGHDGPAGLGSLKRRSQRRIVYQPAGMVEGPSRAATDGRSGRALKGSPVKAADQVMEARRCADTLLTGDSGIALSVRTADCLPVLLADPKHRAVAAVHAGWRGSLARIIEKAVAEMRRVFGSNPADVIAALGPSVRACCYEVGQDVVEAFEGCFARSAGFFTKTPPTDTSHLRERYPLEFLSMTPPGHGVGLRSGVNLDLVAVARHQLLAAGVRSSNIAVAPYCTACRTDLFYSHRKEGALAGRMMAVIGIRER